MQKRENLRRQKEKKTFCRFYHGLKHTQKLEIKRKVSNGIRKSRERKNSHSKERGRKLCIKGETIILALVREMGIKNTIFMIIDFGFGGRKIIVGR